MSGSRTFRLVMLAGTATFGLLALAAPPASASTAPVASRGQEAQFMPRTGPAPASVSPSGCVQRADYPHQSSHQPGTMDGQITTTCNNPVPRITTSAQMWETRWWGWDRIGTKGAGDVGGREILSVTAADGCKNTTIRVTGAGFVVDVDGRTYYASTESIHVTNPCHK